MKSRYRYVTGNPQASSAHPKYRACRFERSLRRRKAAPTDITITLPASGVCTSAKPTAPVVAAKTAAGMRVFIATTHITKALGSNATPTHDVRDPQESGLAGTSGYNCTNTAAVAPSNFISELKSLASATNPSGSTNIQNETTRPRERIGTATPVIDPVTADAPCQANG
jgi:hypothetical protein